MSKHQEVEYSAPDLFALPSGPAKQSPRVFGAPQRYVQGQGVMEHAGHYLNFLGYKNAAVLLSPRSQSAEGARLLASLADTGIGAIVLPFGGECSLEEINCHITTLNQQGMQTDVLVAVGGGKAVDAGKAIAHRLQLPSIVVPSLASNDAPCAAVSVIYTAEGVTLDAEVYRENPVLVLVDTLVVAAADERYLVAGMGDAMATWYEARACANNPLGFTVFGGRPTLAGNAIARLCAETLFEQGEAALESVRNSRVCAALESVVEANTLLSGLGYESGGLAAAHGFAQGFTVLEQVHSNYLHGEMVAIGTLAQLMLEGAIDEAKRVAQFFITIGLPVHLGHLGMEATDDQSIDAVVRTTMAFPFLVNMPTAIDQASLKHALLAADQLGKELLTISSDGAYLKLHS